MNGINDVCPDLDMAADLREPGPVYIRAKQPAGADHLRKVREFYREMNQRAAAIRKGGAR